jgi:hypothetical protein
MLVCCNMCKYGQIDAINGFVTGEYMLQSMFQPTPVIKCMSDTLHTKQCIKTKKLPFHLIDNAWEKMAQNHTPDEISICCKLYGHLNVFEKLAPLVYHHRHNLKPDIAKAIKLCELEDINSQSDRLQDLMAWLVGIGIETSQKWMIDMTIDAYETRIQKTFSEDIRHMIYNLL